MIHFKVGLLVLFPFLRRSRNCRGENFSVLGTHYDKVSSASESFSLPFEFLLWQLALRVWLLGGHCGPLGQPCCRCHENYCYTENMTHKVDIKNNARPNIKLEGVIMWLKRRPGAQYVPECTLRVSSTICFPTFLMSSNLAVSCSWQVKSITDILKVGTQKTVPISFLPSAMTTLLTVLAALLARDVIFCLGSTSVITPSFPKI